MKKIQLQKQLNMHMAMLAFANQSQNELFFC